MNLKLVFTLLTLFGLGSPAKQPVFPPLNGIESRQIVVVNKLKKAYTAGTSAAMLKTSFGKTKVMKEPDEVLGGNAYTYKYKGFEVYFNEKTWEAMDLTTNDHTILLDGLPITIGDNITKLSKRFPLSYKSRKQGGIRLNITYKGKLMDAYVSIGHNAKGVIDRIIIANDNS